VARIVFSRFEFGAMLRGRWRPHSSNSRTIFKACLKERLAQHNFGTASDPAIRTIAGTILCHVELYLADADVRSRDESYRAMQDAEMRRLIAMLRFGWLDVAARINFLAYSP
jgi:hypothetical protein